MAAADVSSPSPPLSQETTPPPSQDTTPLLETLLLRNSRTNGLCWDSGMSGGGHSSEDDCKSEMQSDQRKGVIRCAFFGSTPSDNDDNLGVDCSIQPDRCLLQSDDECEDGDDQVDGAVSEAISPAVLPISPPLHLHNTVEEKSVSLSNNVNKLIEEDHLPAQQRSSPQASCSSVNKPTLCHMSSHAPYFVSALSNHTTRAVVTRGTYGSVEVEVDPFSREFKLGPRPEDCLIRSHSPMQNPLSPQASISNQFSDTLFSPLPISVEFCKNHIPSKAFQDPDFLLYISRLGYPPELSDYVTYKMRVIGDKIEERYSKELNQAMDDILYDLLKVNLTWSGFSGASRKLLVGGAKIQDGILLVPCFARRLMDVVPELSCKIGHYTEMILDNYATDTVLGMGGWVSY